MARLTKAQFEDVFREEVLPHVIDRFERDGIPDKPARREAWNDTVDAYIRDRMLPEAAGNWAHPRWLETWSPKRSNDYDHATKRRSAKKSPAQLDREIAEVLAPHTRPINKRKSVRHFSESRDKKDKLHYFVTYEDRTGHEITGDELERYRQHERGGRAHATKAKDPRPLFDQIIAHDKVTIVDRFGTQRTGRAVMRGPHGWVLNMGGRHGTPAIATHDNTVKVVCGKK